MVVAYDTERGYIEKKFAWSVSLKDDADCEFKICHGSFFAASFSYKNNRLISYSDFIRHNFVRNFSGVTIYYTFLTWGGTLSYHKQIYLDTMDMHNKIVDGGSEFILYWIKNESQKLVTFLDGFFMEKPGDHYVSGVEGRYNTPGHYKCEPERHRTFHLYRVFDSINSMVRFNEFVDLSYEIKCSLQKLQQFNSKEMQNFRKSVCAGQYAEGMIIKSFADIDDLINKHKQFL
ncbi:MAG: hypothetical protein HUJ68_05175 [Clostridia bacterium]|nr:hypothetical protein [Clostridia bacterium]